MGAIPEMEVLIEEIDAVYAESKTKATLSRKEVQERLTSWSAALLTSLPAFIQEQVNTSRYGTFVYFLHSGF